MARKIAVFIPSLAGGGAERVTIALAAGFADRGYPVTLVVGTSRGPLAEHLPDSVELRDLAAPRALAAVGRLWRYLRAERPDVLISAISHASIIAAFVVRLASRRTRLIVMHHNTTSLSTRSVRRRDRLVPALCGVAYRLADAVLAVSRGVAEDLSRSSHLPLERIQVMPNPIEYDRIRLLAAEPVDGALLPPGEAPLVLAAGRFERQKGFDVLLEALTLMREPCRLLLLGDGTLRAELEEFVGEQGLGDRVRMPGFVTNPYPYFALADVYALSSRWEGLPTVLAEALAFRLRIVATDCRSGPDEILAGVDGVELVAVENAAALAGGLDRALAAGRRDAARAQTERYDAPLVMSRMVDVVESVCRAA